MMLPDAKLDYFGELYLAMAERNPSGCSIPTFVQFLWLAHQQQTQEQLLDYAACTYMAELKTEALAR